MSSKSASILLVLLLLASGGVYVAYQQHLLGSLIPYMEEQTAPVADSGGAVSTTLTVDGTEVLFINGIPTSPPGKKNTAGVYYFGNEVDADLNHDGTKDAAYLITKDGGGSGTFFYVVAVLKTDTGYVGTNAILLGDRIAPQTTELNLDNPSDPVIVVNYADRNKGEPMSAQPSVGVSRSFHVVGGKLEERH